MLDYIFGGFLYFRDYRRELRSHSRARTISKINFLTYNLSSYRKQIFANNSIPQNRNVPSPLLSSDRKGPRRSSSLAISRPLLSQFFPLVVARYCANKALNNYFPAGDFSSRRRLITDSGPVSRRLITHSGSARAELSSCWLCIGNENEKRRSASLHLRRPAFLLMHDSHAATNRPPGLI